MKKLLEFVAKSILEYPKDVKVTEEVEKETGVVRLKLSVHPDDIGRAIGKQGRIANAMRNLIRVVAIREGKRVYLDIETPEGGKSQAPSLPAQAGIKPQTKLSTINRSMTKE